MVILYFAANIQTVQLASSNIGSLAGSQAQASGWGLAYDGATGISPVLRYVISTILSNSQCQSEFGSGIPVYDTIICLDGSQGKSTCSVSLYYLPMTGHTPDISPNKTFKLNNSK